MNPELIRNLWLELTARRMGFMALVIGSLLALAFSASGLAEAASIAETIYYGVVVFWGTRCAAQSVVEEIANKTWDGQRLSAIGPWAMVWGKLFGSTALAWFGGAICLVVIAAGVAQRSGSTVAAEYLIYLVTMGVLAHAAAMMASLVAVRRRLSHTRFDVFIYQAVGLLAALLVWRVWQVASPVSLMPALTMLMGFDLKGVAWWGNTYEASGFYVLSLLLFACWTLIANHRLMRRELQVTNGPGVWLAFLAFVAVYVGGFDPWRAADIPAGAALGLRAAQAGLAFIALTYLMVFVEPKEVVAWRWLFDRVRSGRLIEAAGRAPCWIYAYLAAALAAVLAIALAPAGALYGTEIISQSAAIIVATMGFVLRDCGIFIALGLGQTGKRSDLAALAVIAILYAILPGILGAEMGGLGAAFYPIPTASPWLGPVLAWAQAVAIWAFIRRRPYLRRRAPS